MGNSFEFTVTWLLFWAAYFLLISPSSVPVFLVFLFFTEATCLCEACYPPYLAPLRPISSFPRLFSELCVTFVFGLTCFYLYLILTPTSSVLEQVISCSKVFRLFKGITRTSDASSILKCRSRQVCFHSTKINFKSDQKY